jgi:class 3 adenylate cyclase
VGACTDPVTQATVCPAQRYAPLVPLFLDRHVAPGANAQTVADAHLLDLAEQDKHHVRYHTYWFDPEQESIFCLAEGPDRTAIEDVHRLAHGLLADSVIELDSLAPLNQFMGSVPNHPPGTAYTAPGLRAIVFTDVCGSVAQTQQLGDKAHMELLKEHNELVRSALALHDGREVKHTGDGVMAAFTSVVAAVDFATDVQRSLSARNERAATPFYVSIGISAGEPVTADDGDLFGAAVQLAARLCGASAEGDIFVTAAVRDLCVGKVIKFEDRGELVLKGMPEGTRTYAVAWREVA